ncbi:MAG: hypothetical protein AAGC60_10560 [Acidobacteriota bacterium]
MPRRSRPLARSLSVPILLFALVLAVGASSVPMSALADDSVLLHPELPVDTLPLKIYANLLVGVGTELVDRPTVVDLATRTIHVRYEQRIFPVGVPIAAVLIRLEEVAPPPEGEYTLRIEELAEGGDEVLAVVHEETFVVDRGADLTVPPVVASGDAVVPAALGVFDSCTTVRFVEVDDQRRRVRVVYEPGCQITPPPPFAVEIPFDLPGPFAPGTWTVDAVLQRFAGDRQRRAETQFVSIAEPLELADGRFPVEVTWEDFDGGSGRGRAVQAPSRDTGLFWFFDPENTELMVKVLDACDVNSKFWALTAGSTNVAYALTITDRETGAVWRSSNPLGRLAPAVIDVEAFDCSLGDP